MRLLVLTDRPSGANSLLPSLGFLGHSVVDMSLEIDNTQALAAVDVVVVDATSDLSEAQAVCRSAAVHELRPPVLVVASEATLAALKPNWGFDDWVLPGASPGELEARLRLVVEVVGRHHADSAAAIGDLVVDEATWQVRLRGHPLDLTYKEFELLKALASHPGRVFTRELLLQEVWGHDYFGGARTVDVHVRRVRAKLGPEHDHLVQTVRGVGYKLQPPHGRSAHKDGESGMSGVDGH